MNTSSKIVHFVGAGPGATDLITVRGMNLIKEANIIIYAGSLVNPELLKYASQDASIYNSAKMTLDEVMAVISDAPEGSVIVRLHTGEPSIYGAVREQMDELDRLGINYDSCPGVSACFGAAATLNLEYTLPEISQTLIITRLEGKTKVPKLENIRSLAAHRASMAIYLSSTMLGELAKELIAGGYDSHTKTALVYKATWPDEKSFICELENIEKIARENDINKMAVVLVGDAIGQKDYALSRLYAPDFSTAYRTAKKDMN